MPRVKVVEKKVFVARGPKKQLGAFEQKLDQHREFVSMLRQELLTSINVLVDYLEDKKLITRAELQAFIMKKFEEQNPQPAQPEGAQCAENAASTSPSLSSLDKS